MLSPEYVSINRATNWYKDFGLFNLRKSSILVIHLAAICFNVWSLFLFAIIILLGLGTFPYCYISIFNDVMDFTCHTFNGIKSHIKLLNY